MSMQLLKCITSKISLTRGIQFVNTAGSFIGKYTILILLLTLNFLFGEVSIFKFYISVYDKRNSDKASVYHRHVTL